MLFNKGDGHEQQEQCSQSREMFIKSMGNALKQGICWWKAWEKLFNKLDVNEKHGKCSFINKGDVDKMHKVYS